MEIADDERKEIILLSELILYLISHIRLEYVNVF